MSVVSIVAWKGLNDEQKQKWIENCTDIVAEVLQEPLDEIIVYVNEIPKSSWGQAGVIGTNENWATLSTREKKEEV